MISIIIPFYDKDQHHMTNMLNYLSKLTFNKEVIFVDDRNDKTEDIRKLYNIPNEYKIIPSFPTGENVGTFEARKSGIMNASGEYTWCVDIDDEPLNFDTSIVSSKKDIYFFNNLVYYVTTNETYKSLNRPYRVTNFIEKYYYDIMKMDGNVVNLNISNFSNPMLVGYIIRYICLPLTFCIWDKLLKTSTLQETLSEIEPIKNFKYGEDSFLSRLYLKYLIDNMKCASIQFISSPNYKYYEYTPDKYVFAKRYEHFSPDTINYTLSINYKYFKGTWLEVFSLLEDAYEEFETKTGEATNNIHSNWVYSIVEK